MISSQSAGISEWSVKTLQSLADKKCKIGMNALGPDGSETETWTYVHINMFTLSSKARSVSFKNGLVNTMVNM